MRNFTIMITLLACTIGFSQTLPLDFSDPTQLFTGVGATTTDLVEDPDPGQNDQVLQINGGAGQFDDPAQLVMATYIDVTDTANNTITFEFFAAAADTPVLFQLGQEKDGGFAVEILSTSTTAGYNTFTLDFDNADNAFPNCQGCDDPQPVVLGQYAQIAIFVDFGNTTVATHYVDNISGAKNGESVQSDPIPDGPAPTPDTPDAEVYRLYGDTGTYTNNMPYDYTFGTLSGEPNLATDGGTNKALKYDFSVAGWGAGQNNSTDVTSFPNVSFDYWASENSTTFKFFLISQTGGVTTETEYEVGVEEDIVKESWQKVSIPISHFVNQGFDVTNYLQYKFDVLSVKPGLVYIDNIFLSQDVVLGTDDLNISEFQFYPNPSNSSWSIKSAENFMNSIQINDIHGKEIMDIEVDNKEIEISNATLSKGIYFAKVNTERGSVVLKLLKN